MSRAATPNASPITPASLEQLRLRLQEMHAELDQRESELRERLAIPLSETSNAFIAGSEAGLAAEAQDEVIAQIHHEDGLLHEVNAALQRMKDGDYGECADCGESIELARLHAVPWATHCLSCQEQTEKQAAPLRQRLHA